MTPVPKVLSVLNMAPPREPPADVPCRGYWCHTPDSGLFYECGYEWGAFSCSDCVVNGGNMDPRTGQEVEE